MKKIIFVLFLNILLFFNFIAFNAYAEKQVFQMVFASIVVFIDGDRCIVFLPGESMEGKITSEGETVTFKMKNTKTAKYYKNEIGKEYLIMADEDEEFSLVLYKKFEI